MKINLMHLVGEGLLPECSIGDQEQTRLKLKHAWQLHCDRFINWWFIQKTFL